MDYYQQKTLRISATTLDIFSTYLQPNSWITTKEKLIEMLTTFVSSRQMENGTAVHKILETGIIDVDLNLCEELEQPCLTIHAQLQEGTFESKYVKHYPEYNVNVVTKPDCILGNTVYEFKTTATFDYKKYLKSVQWKFYLENLEAMNFIYIVIPIKEKTIKDEGQDDSLVLTQTDSVFQFQFTKLDYNPNDLHILIQDFVLFINQNNLESYYYQK
jgi:hypothetical protein